MISRLEEGFFFILLIPNLFESGKNGREGMAVNLNKNLKASDFFEGISL